MSTIYDHVAPGIEVKVKESLALSEHHTTKAYWGVEVQLHAFLTSALDGGEWSASRPGRFTPVERAPGKKTDYSVKQKIKVR
jgi:hypothetical protein